MSATLTLLGSGGSLGVPMIGCSCAVCTSANPKNRRLRSAALLKANSKQYLIDVGPDIHTQALQAGLSHLDGVLITHVHYDHIAGIDELRVFAFKSKQPLPLLLSAASFKDLSRRYDYLLSRRDRYVCQVLEEKGGATTFQGLPLRYITYDQVGMQVTGFRFGELAYLTDVKVSTPEMIAAMQGVRVLFLNALRGNPSRAHLSVEEAIALAQKIGAATTYFIHLSHELDYDATNRHLPKGVALAFDGLTVAFEISNG